MSKICGFFFGFGMYLKSHESAKSAVMRCLSLSEKYSDVILGEVRFPPRKRNWLKKIWNKALPAAAGFGVFVGNGTFS